MISCLACEKHDLARDCRGIIFLGCVHNETHRTFETALQACARIDMGLSSREAARSADYRGFCTAENMANLKQICSDYKRLGSSLNMVTFSGTKTTRLGSRVSFRSESSRFLIEERLSIIDNSKHVAVQVKQDYSTLARFCLEKETAGDVIVQEIHKMIAYGPGQMPLCSACASSSSNPGHATPVTSNGNAAQPVGSASSTPGAYAVAPKLNSLQTAFSHKLNFSNTPMGNVNLPCHTIKVYCDPSFVGRETEIKKLNDLLQQPTVVQTSIVLLHGLGGIGKTQTAVQYASRSKNYYNVILFARAEDETKIAIDFAEFAQSLGLVDVVGKDLVKPRELLKQWLSSTVEKWLIVFDNVESAESLHFLESYLPGAGCGAILITSRKKDLYKTLASEEMELNTLPGESAVTLLRTLNPKIKSSDGRQLQTIVSRVDRLPLGIIAAASAMRNGSYSPLEFLESYDSRDLIEEAAQPGKSRQSRYHLNIATVWNMEFGQLSDDARLLLNACACIDARSISEDLILDGASRCGEPAFALLKDKKLYLRCRAELYQTSLISREETSKNISMHRLVEENCHFRMETQDARPVFDFVTSLLNKMLPEFDDYERHLTALWPKVRPILDHVIAFCKHADHPRHKTAVTSKNPMDSSLEPKHSRTLTYLLYRAAW